MYITTDYVLQNPGNTTADDKDIREKLMIKTLEKRLNIIKE